MSHWIVEGWLGVCMLIGLGGWVVALFLRDTVLQLQARIDRLEKLSSSNPWTHLRSNPVAQRNDEITGRARRGNSQRGETT